MSHQLSHKRPLLSQITYLYNIIVHFIKLINGNNNEINSHVYIYKCCTCIYKWIKILDRLTLLWELIYLTDNRLSLYDTAHCVICCMNPYPRIKKSTFIFNSTLCLSCCSAEWTWLLGASFQKNRPISHLVLISNHTMR